MSFFKDFKDDLSQAVSELMPSEAPSVQDAPEMVDTISQPIITENPEAGVSNNPEADELASLLATLDMDVVNEGMNDKSVEAHGLDIPVYTETVNDSLDAKEEVKSEVQPIFAPDPEPASEEAHIPVEPIFAPDPEPSKEVKEPVAPVFAPDPEPLKEEVKEPVAPVFSASPKHVTPINTISGGNMNIGSIPEGMTIVGDIESDGSLDIMGTVKGNISILGKLNITGTVEGNSKASEVFADGAKIVGEVVSQGTVKVGNSSIIKGNITATSAVLAGAVKGDIDVNGPVVLDSTAIIMGNIKSKSIQINNGAAIEGLCSQCYADISPVSFFTEE